jgi:tetratricopeptide (TPR) repeat protein
MGGIAARTLRKNADGVDCYRALLKLWNPGPTLVHQTFGNLLDDLELHEEALEHRKIAVAMEPTAWSLQGLALSLEGLKRYQEADDAYVKTIALAPTSKYYTDWAHMLLDWEHNNDVVEKCAKAVELDPNNARAYGIWGACLARQSFLREAMSLYEKAVKIDPQADWIFDNMALAAKAMGNQAQADEYSKKAAAIRAGNK